MTNKCHIYVAKVCSIFYITNKYVNIFNYIIMSISERIKLIAEEKGISLRKLSLSIGKTAAYLSISIRKNTELGTDALLKILQTYPEYNIEWVLTGEGDKYKIKPKTENHINESSENYSLYVKNDVFINFKNKLKHKISVLHKICDALKKDCEDLKNK